MRVININSLYNLPIQFKELNHSDFEEFIFEDREKTIISPDNNGFISDELNRVIDLEKKDTTVINGGVGQGKTKAIIDFIKWYYEQNFYNNGKYKIIIITPFKSLNQEYIRKIQEAIGEDVKYFEYQELDEQKRYGYEGAKNYYKMNYSNPIQLISIMSILGDAGGVYWKQSDYKRKYYEFLIKQCKINNEKVILFFDELHESLKSFTQELLPNLFKWKRLVYKIFVASATFSESSKVPIKYFAMLTENKLKIIESERIQNNENLSELHLCFYNQIIFNPDTIDFLELIKEELNTASKINILCETPKVARKIYESSVGKMIKSKFGSLNLCSSQSKESFNKEECNIGTNFKTGISIEEENSVFIVIMPLKLSYVDEKKSSMGIFSDGIISLIQALARLRKKSKIFVITPPPNKIILETPLVEDFNKYIDDLSLDYLNFHEAGRQAYYKDLNQQDSILRNQYNSLTAPISEQIDELTKLHNELKINYQKYDWFKLKQGDKNLRKEYDIFGKDLSNYLYWAAWNDQFTNCKLKSIRKDSVLIFEKGKVQLKLEEYFPLEYINYTSFLDFSDKELYNKLKSEIFSNNVYYNIEEEVRQRELEGIEVENKWDKYLQRIKPVIDSIFEQQIIHFLQRRKTPYLFEPEYGCTYSLKNNDEPIDVKISKEQYIRICISQCTPFFESTGDMLLDDYAIINAYRDLYEFRDILMADYTVKNSNQDYIFPIEKNFKFKNIHAIKLKTIFNILIEKDKVLKIFSLKNLFTDSSIFTMLRNIFFNSSLTTMPTGKNIKGWKIDRIRPLPNCEHSLNLVYTVRNPWYYFSVPPDTPIQEDIVGNETFDFEIIDWLSDNNDSVEEDYPI